MARVKPLEKFRFPNGNFFFFKGRIIDPSSKEGRKIQAILKLQKTTRAANTAQKSLHKAITNAKNAKEAIQYLVNENVSGTQKPSVARAQMRAKIGHVGPKTKAMLKQELRSLENQKIAFMTSRKRTQHKKKIAEVKRQLRIMS